VSALHALASVPPSNGATAGYWTLELSCTDPVTGGFASGCYRTEYRVNGGSLTPIHEPDRAGRARSLRR
jgi:hypothetical protein